MYINLKISPYVLKARDIKQLKAKINSNYRGASFVFSSKYGDALMNEDNVYVYSIEKHRPKKNANQQLTEGYFVLKNKKTNIVESGYAKAYVYKLSKKFLEGNKLKVKQNTRTWELTS